MNGASNYGAPTKKRPARYASAFSGVAPSGPLHSDLLRTRQAATGSSAVTRVTLQA